MECQQRLKKEKLKLKFNNIPILKEKIKNTKFNKKNNNQDLGLMIINLKIKFNLIRLFLNPNLKDHLICKDKLKQKL